ncbi:MAG: NTP transferase domain-containing protein [Pseudomonadota bacterium]|nr:NTP transferase domain-containing protein [Pseudomonadota bacterium]
MTESSQNISSTPVLAAVVLAGGASRRMGQDKAQLQRPDGQTQLSFTCDVARRCGADPVWVSLASPDKTEAQHSDRICTLVDAFPDSGPIAGIASALAAAGSAAQPHSPIQSRPTHLLVLPCDLPYLNPEALAPLLEGLTPDLEEQAPDLGEQAPSQNTTRAYQQHYLPCVIADIENAKIVADEILRKQENLSIRAFLSELGAIFIEPDDTAKQALINTNAPGDWQQFINNFSE